MTETGTESERASRPPHPWLGYSVLALVLFLPGGVGALFHSIRCMSQSAAGDLEEARVSSARARTWALTSIAIGLMVVVLLLILGLVYGSNDQNTYR